MKSFLKTFTIVLLLSGLILITSSCKKRPAPIILSTTNVTDVTQTSAVSGGKITKGNEGSVTAKGICWGTTSDPSFTDNKTSNGNGTGAFTSSLTGLQPGTRYYVRAYAITRRDTVYDSSISFSTQDYGTVTDVEDNSYKTITIGTQTWMAGNLKTTRYNDGTAIPYVAEEAAWAGLSKPGYSWYKNDESAFKSPYGALYNWYSVSRGKLCPAGWHVPDNAEWTILTTFLGGESIAGGKLKETGTTYWVDPNGEATNEFSYKALPGGFRYYDGKFFDFGFSCYWWSSVNSSESKAWFRFIYYEDGSFYRFDNNKKMGLSIRCIKDS